MHYKKLARPAAFAVCKTEVLGVSKAPCKAQWKADKIKFAKDTKEYNCGRAVEIACENYSNKVHDDCNAAVDKYETYPMPVPKFDAATMMDVSTMDSDFLEFYNKNECGKKALITIELPHNAVTNQCPNAFGTAGPVGTLCCGPQLKDLCGATQ